MLPKSTRLTGDEMADLMKRGRRIRGTHLSLVYRAAETTRYGVVVGKKVAGTAVVRNRLRRVLYTACRGNDEAPFSPGMHAALLLHMGARTLPAPELREQARALLTVARRQLVRYNGAHGV